jgi:hypothetical protein
LIVLALTFATIDPHHRAALSTWSAPLSTREISVELVELAGETASSITPRFRVRVMRAATDPLVTAIGIRVASTPLVINAPLLDTAVVGSDSADILLNTPLPSATTVFIRGYARTATGDIVYSPPSSARVVPEWLVLLFPGAPTGAIIEEKMPTFKWSSAPVNVPPGPWTYSLVLSRTAGGAALFTVTTSDSSVTLPFPLEISTSYRWAVTARLQANPATAITRSSSFVIVDENVPRTTLLYQTFPNPFPSPLRSFACIWFDLAERSSVAIEILDIRSNRVRRLFPTPGGAVPVLEPGRYGRAVTSAGGCTTEFTWDGTDDLGRKVIPGVYIVRLRAGGREFTRRMVFRG